jgi:hypothetical protein
MSYPTIALLFSERRESDSELNDVRQSRISLGRSQN